LSHQTIVYDIHFIINISLTIYQNSNNINQFIIKPTNHKNTKNNGIVNIFKIGFIVILINHKIIHQIKYISGSQFTIIPASNQLLFAHNKYVIANSIEAFNRIENNTFIFF